MNDNQSGLLIDYPTKPKKPPKTKPTIILNESPH